VAVRSVRAIREAAHFQIGVDLARKTGKKLGRPRALVDEEKIRAEIAGGGSIRATAKRWGVSRGVVRRLCATKRAS